MGTKIRNLSEYNDRIGFIVLSASSRFPKVGPFGDDQIRNIEIAFESLWDGFPFVEKKIESPEEISFLRQLLRASLTAYQQGDQKKGAHLLQDFQDVVFPNRFKDYEERNLT